MATEDEHENSEDVSQKTQKKSSKIFPCRFEGCESIFRKLSHLLRHELIHNDVRPFQCTHEGCEKAFRSKSHLKRHEVTHSGIKTFVCPYESCEVACYNSWNLKRHIKRTHQATFKCSKCDKEFKKNKLLQDHISVEHKRSVVSCNFPGCAQVFKNEVKMRHHQKKHSGKTYVCPVKGCSKRFALWSQCRLHTAECKDKVSRKCEICEKTFSTRSNLKVHKKVHEENREVFLCSYDNCGRFYTKQSNLKMHIQSFHQNIRPFECHKDDCNKSFPFRHQLRAHLDYHKRKENKNNEAKKSKRPKRMVTTDLAAITGYIPDLSTKMTPAEMNAFVNGTECDEFDPRCMDDTDIIQQDLDTETTQEEMEPMLSEEFSSSVLKYTTADEEISRCSYIFPSSSTISKCPKAAQSSHIKTNNYQQPNCELAVTTNISEDDDDDKSFALDKSPKSSTDDTLTARTSDLELECDNDDIGMILERSNLEEATSYLNHFNDMKKNAKASTNSSRSSSDCSSVGDNMKILNVTFQQLESCRMQSGGVVRTDSDSSDSERILCA